MAAVLEAVIRRDDLAALEPCGDPVHAPDQQLRTDPKDMLGLFFSNTSLENRIIDISFCSTSFDTVAKLL